jgi:hypothetical protein
MLQEARARLANTKGKKAKRKAREVWEVGEIFMTVKQFEYMSHERWEWSYKF